MVKIYPNPDKRQELIDILLTVKGSALAMPGCSICSVYNEYDEATVLYLELWDTEAEMKRHLRSLLYSRVLEAMELSVDSPEITFYTISRTDGIALIGEVRGTEIM